MRKRINFMHYSLKMIKITPIEIIFFIRQSATQPSGTRHPREMKMIDVKAFLSILAYGRTAPASPHNDTKLDRISQPLYRDLAGRHRASPTSRKPCYFPNPFQRSRKLS
jgi:hypothetical protein